MNESGSFRLLGRLRGLLLTTAILGCGSNLAAAAVQSADLDRQVPFALAVRGGVSLGSYEAGFEWALLRYLKNARDASRSPDQGYVDLVATSGASAGSINALISTLSWCIDPDKTTSAELFPDTVSDNLLFDTWYGIGFEELLPEKVDSLEYYRADDGVLSRNAFRDTIGRIQRLLQADGFVPGCEGRFGILVTRVDPAVKDFAGVRVHNQRFVIPLRLRVDPRGHGRFVSCLVDAEDPAFGNVMYLQGTPTADPECPIEHDTNAIVDAIEASSAFPIAFGRKLLRYCEPAVTDEASTAGEDRRCPAGMRPVLDEFVDGGLFDNIPLGAAKALAEPNEWTSTDGSAQAGAGRRFNYIYLDPTIRRNVGPTSQSTSDRVEAALTADSEETDEVTYGLRSQLSFLFGAISSGRDYELYNLLRSGEWTNQVFAISDRLADTISELYPDLEPAAPNLADLPSFLPGCSQWFEADIDATGLPERDVVARASQCIATGVYLLEQQYRGTPVGQELYGRAEITRQRNELIDWVIKLARHVGEDRLAMAAGQARDDKLGDRRILLSSRYSPVVGEMMFAFGGFVDKSFREYDYYAGVYDAVWGIVDFLCERQFERPACLAGQIRRIYVSLGIPQSPAADTVFKYLLSREYGDKADSDSDFAWVSAETVQDANMLAIANSLFADDTTGGDYDNTAPTISEFISRLVEQDYDASEASDFLKRIFRLRDKEELTWYYPLTMRASNRLLLLEHRESEVLGGGEFYKTALSLGAFYLHSYMREEEITLNVSTAPDFAWQAWLPDEIAIDARNGGLDLSWYQGRQMTKSGWRWDVKMTPIQLTHSGGSRDENVWFSQADFLVSRRTHGTLSAFGFGPSVNWTWDQWPNSEQTTYGAMLYIGFIEDKFRISIGKASFSDDFAGGNLYINVGINDVPGLAYWGWSGSRRSWWPFQKE